MGMGEVRQRERKINFEKFGMFHVAGRKVCHLSTPGNTKTRCGLYRLGLVVTPNEGPPVCKNCKRTVRIVKELGRRIAVFRGADGVASIVEGLCVPTLSPQRD